MIFHDGKNFTLAVFARFNIPIVVKIIVQQMEKHGEKHSVPPIR
jgi:hypothetical protein